MIRRRKTGNAIFLAILLACSAGAIGFSSWISGTTNTNVNVNVGNVFSIDSLCWLEKNENNEPLYTPLTISNNYNSFAADGLYSSYSSFDVTFGISLKNIVAINTSFTSVTIKVNLSMLNNVEDSSFVLFSNCLAGDDSVTISYVKDSITYFEKPNLNSSVANINNYYFEYSFILEGSLLEIDSFPFTIRYLFDSNNASITNFYEQIGKFLNGNSFYMSLEVECKWEEDLIKTYIFYSFC